MFVEAYSDWGTVLVEAGDLSAGLERLGRAIAIREQQRQLLGNEWSLDLGSGLAVSYSNRGAAVFALAGDALGALQDHNRAVEILEHFKDQLGEDPGLVKQLAVAYSNRGEARAAADNLAGALEDHGRAIESFEHLRVRLGEDVSPRLVELLAIAYASRGVVLSNEDHLDAGDSEVARMDFGRAVNTLEQLRDQLGEQWSPRMAHELAAVYANRGDWQAKTGDRSGAMRDFGSAIAILEGLRVQLGQGWPPRHDELLRRVHELQAVASSGAT